EDGARGARGRDAVAGYRAVHAKHENVVAQDLKIVAGVVARGEALVVEHRLASVCGHLEVAAEAGWSPGGVTGVAGHGGVGVREDGIVFGGACGEGTGFGDELGPHGLPAEVRIA